MNKRLNIAPVRVLPEVVANKIAAGEVVERPASVVKELVENALDAGATRIVVRLIAAGRRTIEVADNGHGMSAQDALLAIERHATSKIRSADDLDNIQTLGFRGEALASIGAVSRMELVTRRAEDHAATRVRIEGGILRDTGQAAAPPGTRVSVNRLYFNTPARAKFLKGVTTELSHCIDVVQRHALANEGVGFQLYHNDKLLLDIPEAARLRERAALIWGLSFSRDLLEIDSERMGLRVRGLMGSPALSRSQRSHQYFFLNGRPIVNRAVQFGFEEGYHELLTVGRRPVGILLIETHPRFVDVNIHPAKREVRFRDERAVRAAIREMARARLAQIHEADETPSRVGAPRGQGAAPAPTPRAEAAPAGDAAARVSEPSAVDPHAGAFSPPRPATAVARASRQGGHDEVEAPREPMAPSEWLESGAEPVQTEFKGEAGEDFAPRLEPAPVYRGMGEVGDAPLQLFETYLLVPEEQRLLIIDQHALHERLTYDSLVQDLKDHDYAAQQLAVPILVDVAPSQVRLLENNIGLFAKLGIEIEHFGGNTFQITGICHLYDEGRIADAVYKVLDALAQGDLFSREGFMADLLRLTVEACRSSVKAGDYLSPQERRGLIEGFRRLQPPYTCPHGRPIITELTLAQMEKSFRRRQ